MTRRRKAKEDKAVLGIQAVFAVLILIALAGGGLNGFAERLVGLIVLVLLASIALAALVGIILVIQRTDWSQLTQNNSVNVQPNPRPISSTFTSAQAPIFRWTTSEILKYMSEIDWYQFEKFCASILEAEGFTVARKGGASPDGGVDLIVQKNQTRTLIQCKHWRTWKIREPVIRQLLGSMIDFEVNKAAVFFSGHSTEPAMDFAAKHGIGLVNGEALAERALNALSTEQLNQILKCKEHHCPKCDSLMVWRTGDFKPFWGCSRFPKCRGTLKHSGPR
ncbi:restriction endonuclease [Coraliomargarita sp. SDUM461003]|uniref:Restriction endonuclease n=1 Tax=Thalassobacterium maritimum TaxID=3041265 RepID=A0ABU1AYR7_9BACT|nr:restriction endonuclease [Coraliomargarita sp. SDUM461003]MDQ8209303.1 restriction endonuclease [Coraliomargarita sp. SDUM461003]